MANDTIPFPIFRLRMWNRKLWQMPPTALSGRELDLYQMIATAFCLQFYPLMRYEAQKIALEIGDNRFEATGRAILESGWTSVNQDEDEDEAA